MSGRVREGKGKREGGIGKGRRTEGGRKDGLPERIRTYDREGQRGRGLTGGAERAYITLDVAGSVLEYAGAMSARHTKRHSDLLTSKRDPIARQLGTLSFVEVAHVNEGKPTGDTCACCISNLHKWWKLHKYVKLVV